MWKITNKLLHSTQRTKMYNEYWKIAFGIFSILFEFWIESENKKKMTILNSCCFWHSLRKGSFASGLYTLVIIQLWLIQIGVYDKGTEEIELNFNEFPWLYGINRMVNFNGKFHENFTWRLSWLNHNLHKFFMKTIIFLFINKLHVSSTEYS
jgi:hypothetical protein